MNQNIWGPEMWTCLHTISLNYPLKPTYQDKLDYYKFFYALKNVLPCGWCRKNYERNIRELPIRLNSKRDFVYWLIDLHNEVNGKEGKRPYTYNEVIKYYEDKLKKKIKFDRDDIVKCDFHNKECFIKYLPFIVFILIFLYLLTL